MRITFVLPSIQLTGGVKSTFELANSLGDRGHEVTVLYPFLPTSAGSRWYVLGDLTSRVKVLYSNLKQRKGVQWFDLNTSLVRVSTLAEENIPEGDVIVATWWANAHDIKDYGDDKGAKFYIIRHYEVWGGPEDLVNQTYVMPLNKIAVSSWLQNLIQKKFNVRVDGPVMNGVDPEVFYRERNGFDAHDPKRVGLLYRKMEWKGMREALSSFAAIQKDYRNTQFVIFGEKPVHDDRKMMSEIKNVEYHRMPYKSRLREIFNSLDVFVFPSHSEGFGNPPLEAMACGVACVSTSIGAIPDYSIPGETILLVEPKQPEQLADAVIALLSDEERRQGIAKAGHEYAKQFTWDGAVNSLERIFALRMGNNYKQVL